MKQMSLGESGFERKTKRTRKREFLDEMNLVVPWAELVSLIAPHAPAPSAKGGRPPFAVETMLRIHFLQQWCWRRWNIDHLCRLNFDQGLRLPPQEVSCG